MLLAQGLFTRQARSLLDAGEAIVLDLVASHIWSSMSRIIQGRPDPTQGNQEPLRRATAKYKGDAKPTEIPDNLHYPLTYNK